MRTIYMNVFFFLLKKVPIIVFLLDLNKVFSYMRIVVLGVVTLLVRQLRVLAFAFAAIYERVNFYVSSLYPVSKRV